VIRIAPFPTKSRASWIEFLSTLEGTPRDGPRIAAQTATRQPGLSHSTSPVESALRQIDRRIGDRVGSFTNRARLAKLLQLMALDLRGQADSRQWADRLREQLYLAGGRPATHQRTADDPHGTWSLLA
jgi:hypothetical protein